MNDDNRQYGAYQIYMDAIVYIERELLSYGFLSQILCIELSKGNHWDLRTIHLLTGNYDKFEQFSGVLESPCILGW